MKKLIFLLILTSFLLIGCGKKEETSKKDVLGMSWEEIEKNAHGQTVSITMWGGSKEINKYYDEFIAPNLKKEYNITLKRVPVTDIRQPLNKLVVEKEANKVNGSTDVIWLNGENFKFAKTNGILLGDINSKLPNIEGVDPNALRNDFGEPVDGLEAPLGQANFIMITEIKNPPKTAAELRSWVIKNPGRFTYSNPNDFVGNAFIRTLAVDLLGRDDFTVEEMGPVWDYLNEIKPYLWREGKTYPESSEKNHELFASGEVDFTISYTPSIVENKVALGEFPKDTYPYVMSVGSFTNNHYLTIAKNTQNPEAALVFINYMISNDPQEEKMKSSVWGDGAVTKKLKEELFSPQLEELSPEVTEGIKDEWYEKVAKG
ncbi:MULTISPECIES: ABC transporter substrate-binding protein [Psychrilyobacter]|uniref:ABC transporter substrate-binding protein n=1 Tax=Psychrilyobacter piezotolerans TaxID=2293438 RepID=A0ABX9KE63_9FUSO|nr:MULTISPECIES: ABC transporter substrate-binding protein [Psychrilyobacter]MCS5422984.1 ABC transporter substrate-binding protein [Psychrilyobacter sp. S5]NDI78858.1 ABC transporter substrate-binding protein [Psychrilyobacter piezotolerans]RDE59456.1 ABC transporter substrate-binding protein [Psychrilyobacter sp. S5]REI39926.1 ABC transporter substrate-binding protein [Psychrilyobacter piezotolerans]